MIKRLPEKFLQVIQENDGLLRYLESLAKGRPFTDRSWLYESKEPDQILNSWIEKLRVLEQGSTFEKEVYQFDISQVEKWGPQGGIKPMSDLLDEIVLPTFSAPSPARGLGTRSWEWACTKVGEVMRRRNVQGLRLAPYQSVVDDMRARDTLESNSGWPSFARRNKPEVVRAAIAAAQDGDWIDYPAIALFRNYNLKTRLVWMYPMATNVIEGSFMQPAQSAIIKRRGDFDFYAPWSGFEAVRQMITRAYSVGAYVYATDFSKTDEHFKEPQVSQVWRVLAPLFRDLKVHDDLGVSLMHMLNIPLVISDSQMVVGHHGVSSGSNWTNFVETIFDEIFGWYHSSKHAGNGVSGLCAIGDDMAWIADEFDEGWRDVIAKDAQSVGQETNADKVSNSPNKVKFLQRLFQRGYSRSDGQLRGVYSTIRALKSSVYPERFHKPELWSSDMFCARQYMILENCVDHPLFEEFVKFVVYGQKDLLPFARKSQRELDNILRKTKLLPGFNPTYNQEKRDSSLSSFASIRFARTLS